MQEVFQVQKQITRRPVREMQQRPVAQQKEQQSELTREQYLDLLKTAKRMRKMPAYLAMRMFVSTGVRMQELLALTVEEVRSGEITTAERIIHLPDSLREELLDYAGRNGAHSGPVFAGKTGGAMSAVAIRDQIRAVSRAAGLEDGAATAKALQKLYETTRAEMMAQVTEKLMLEQLDREQAEHGWES